MRMWKMDWKDGYKVCALVLAVLCFLVSIGYMITAGSDIEFIWAFLPFVIGLGLIVIVWRGK